MRLLWRSVQAEQVRRSPAQRFRLLAPLGEEVLGVLDALPPAANVNQGWGAELEVGKDFAVAPARRELDDFDTAGGAIRLSRDCLIGRSRFGRRMGVLKVLRVSR